MITERDEVQEDERKSLGLSVIASLIVNLLAWMFVIWGTGLHMKPHPVEFKEREFIVSSSSLRLEKRTVPQPPHPITQPAQQRQAVQPKPRQMPRQERIAKMEPHPRPTEIARIVQNAPAQQKPEKSKHEAASLQSQLAQQEQMFAREAEQMHAAQQAPLSAASAAPFAPSSIHRSYMDLSGQSNREEVNALLEPIPGRHWIANGMSCYYVHYYAQYGGGGSEEGNIPWPLCYPAAHDAMLPLDRTHKLPIPSPPVGYVLPAGTTLGPLLEAIYTHQISEEHS